MKPGLSIDPTDIFAIVLMVIFSMRRVDLRATEAAAFPRIPPQFFETWKRRALFARNLSINACFAKFALNSAWFYGFRNHVPPLFLIRGGLLIFGAWFAAMLLGWWLFSRSMNDARRFGIVIGKRVPEPLPAGEDAPSPSDDAKEGSSP